GLFETISYRSLSRLFPAIWVAFVLQFLRGFALWMTKPAQYVADGAFVLKSSLVIVGIILTLYFHGAIKREGHAWEAAGAIPSRVVKFVAAALLVWGGDV